jgi:FkbM family methyltransferase
MSLSLSLFGLISLGLRNFDYLIKSNHTFKNKIIIILTLIRIFLKFLLFDKLFKLKHERIFGYKISAFDYSTIIFLFAEIFYKNEYYINSKNNKPIILDCGANIGIATLYFKWLYPESEIYAFEPDKITFEMLTKNVLQNKLKNVYLFNSAISDRNGIIDLYVDHNSPGSLLMHTKPERIPKEKVTVNCISLSSFINEKKISQIDFVKMDIEGSEIEAIQDLDENKQLNKIIKFVIEYHHNMGKHKSSLSEFLSIFEKNGFEYQIDACNIPINHEYTFQDVLLYVYK